MGKKNGKSAVLIGTILSKLQFILGSFLTFFCGLMLLVGATMYAPGDGPAIIFLLVILALGIGMILRGRKSGKLIQLFKSYVAALSADPHHCLDCVASATNSSVDVVRANMEQMLKKGYFAGAYIDNQTNCLVLPSEVVAATSQTISFHSASDSATYQTVVCKGCGATNKIAADSIGECEFCGSQLRA